MSDEPTFQDLLAGFSDDLFVGRSEQLALFERALIAPKPPFLILAVSGQGGVGKTTLLQQFRHIALTHSAVTALANEDQLSVVTTLAYLAKQLGEAGCHCKTFDERYRKYRELKQQMEADPQAPKSLLDFAVRSATRIGVRSFKSMPIVGDIAKEFLPEESEDEVVDHVSAFAGYVAQKFGNKDETVLLLETEAELTRHFLSDLNDLAKKRRFILCFDTFEKTSRYLDTWLRDLLEGKFGKFSGRILFIIAGRYPLGQDWMHFKKAIQPVELQEFTEAEAREYLTSTGITEEAHITQMLTLSHRLPVLLALLASAPGAIPTEVAGTAVERFLQGTTPEQREAALAASLPRRFNVDILEVILGKEAARPAFAWLSEAHFVRPRAEGWAYHEVVRNMMLRYFRLRSLQSYNDLHAKLAAYYATLAEALALPEKEQWESKAWRGYELERLYHYTSQSPAKGLQEIVGFLLLDPRKEESEYLPYSRVLTQVSEENNEVSLKAWAQKLERLDAFSQKTDSLTEEEMHIVSIEVLEIMNTVCNWVALDSRILSAALSVRGLIRSYMENSSAALSDFDKAIELLPDDVDNYHWRGSCHQEAKNYPAALADFDKAIELQPDDAGNYQRRGRCHQEAKNYPSALADFGKAIELQPSDGNNYYRRGMCHREFKNVPAALADFDKAIELQPSDGDKYYWRGMCHREFKNFPAALADFDKAIGLQPDDAGNYLQRGRCHQEATNYPSALADLDKAIELEPSKGYYYYWRGMCYKKFKNIPAALVDFDKAIELEPSKGYNYCWRGTCHREFKNIPAALTDFDKAIELQPDDASNYWSRGRCYFEMREYQTALNDFNKAIELESDEPHNRAWRGRVHLELNDTASAQEDFNRVESLLKDNGWPAYHVAGGYAKLGQSEEALRWLRLAFERDKSLVEEINTDTDFDAIRATAELQALLQEFV